MKKFIKISVLMSVIVSFCSHASDLSYGYKNGVKFVKLYDETKIYGLEIAKIQFNPVKKGIIEFIELKEGSIIDSHEIENVFIIDNRLLDLMGNKILVPLRNIGDGSGG